MNENPIIPVRYPDTLLACIQQLYHRGIQMNNLSLSTPYKSRSLALLEAQ